VLERRAGPSDPESGVKVASAPVTLKAGAPVWLKITARGGAYDFSYALTAGQWKTLKAGEDGTILSTKKAGGFVGALLGVYAHDGAAQGRWRRHRLLTNGRRRRGDRQRRAQRRRGEIT
jgi:xylan 1,4-beta-xylosidase